MHPVIVVTELGLLPSGERWEKLVVPLQEQLVESGLGRVLDFERLQRETAGLGYFPAEEVAVELRHLGYGRERTGRVGRWVYDLSVDVTYSLLAAPAEEARP